MMLLKRITLLCFAAAACFAQTVQPGGGGGSSSSSGGITCVATMTSNVAVCNPSNPPVASYGTSSTGYVQGVLTVSAGNTGAFTLQIGTGAAVSVLTSSGGTPGSGYAAAGSYYQFAYNGTNFVVTPAIGPTGPAGALGPAFNRATSFTIDCTNDLNATENSTGAAVTVTVPACSANSVTFSVIGSTAGAVSFTASGSTFNGGGSLTALPQCTAANGCAGYRFVQNPATASNWVVFTTQGPAGTNGTNGATGATGPSGPTGPTGPTGGGSALFATDSLAGVSTPPSSGSAPLKTDTLLYTSPTLAALAAGGCYRFELDMFFSNGAGGDNPAIWYGTSLGASTLMTYMYQSTSTASRMRGRWCNDSGSQSAQHYTVDGANITATGGYYGSGTTAISTTGSSNKMFLTNATNGGSGITSSIIVTQFSVWLE